MKTTIPSVETLAKRIDVAMGRTKPSLVIRNAKVLSVIDGSIEETDIVVAGDTIASVYERFSDEEIEGAHIIDARGQFAVPGFINAHAHIESSTLLPYEYERLALPMGETTVVADPHEAANVLGAKGIEMFQKASTGMVMDMIVQNSSCVPATSLETSGATLLADDLAALMNHPRSGGLAEMMNIGGLLGKDTDVLKKLSLFGDTTRPIDGHMPGMRGRALNAFRSCNICNDHESTTVEEAMEKMRKGIQVFMREGTVCKDLGTLLPLLSARTAPHVSFCTDDMKPHDIVAQGGTIAHSIRKAIAGGADVASTYRAATLSAAEHFSLRDRGALTAGRIADIVLVGSLEACDVSGVIKRGEVVKIDGAINNAVFERRPETDCSAGYNSVKAALTKPASFAVTAQEPVMDVIGVVEGKIVTEALRMPLPVIDGEMHGDITQDVIKLAVVERYGKSGAIGIGFVHGFGITDGAIASTVAHDHHNIMVAGSNDRDMSVAANRLIDMGGGFAIVKNGRVLADYALPVAGLMTDQPYEQAIEGLKNLKGALAQVCPIEAAFMNLSFLGLCVIPSLKLTDKGLTMFQPEKGDHGPRLIRGPRGNTIG